MFCAGIVNGQKSPISSMKRAIFDDFGDLKGIIGGKRGKEWRNPRETFPISPSKVANTCSDKFKDADTFFIHQCWMTKQQCCFSVHHRCLAKPRWWLKNNSAFPQEFLYSRPKMRAEKGAFRKISERKISEYGELVILQPGSSFQPSENQQLWSSWRTEGTFLHFIKTLLSSAKVVAKM